MPTVGVVLVVGLVLRLFHAGFVAFGDAFYVHGVDAQGFHDMADAIVSGQGSHELREGYWYVSLLAASTPSRGRRCWRATCSRWRCGRSRP